MKNYNKPHSKDRVEGKEGKEIYQEKTPEHKRPKNSMGSFEDGHVVMDGEAGKIKMGTEKQKMGNVAKQDLSKGVGEPMGMVKLAHHNSYDPSVYMSTHDVFPKESNAEENKDKKGKKFTDSGKHGEDNDHSGGEM